MLREDSFKHKGLRRRLVETIASKGIERTEVLKAIGNIPRHWFLDSALAEHAYEDKALPIDEEQTISQPFTVAYQTEQLNLEPGMKVLEIGTGSGYQAAVLCEMGAEVYSIERHEALHRKAAALLKKMSYSAFLTCGDGTLGWPEHAPFDRIIVTAAAPSLGKALSAQLAPSGVMVIPIGKKSQRMFRINRDARGNFHSEKLDLFKFVPMIGEEGFKVGER